MKTSRQIRIKKPQEKIVEAISPYLTGYGFEVRSGSFDLAVIDTIAHELGHFFHLAAAEKESFKTYRSLASIIGNMTPERQWHNELQARAVNYLISRKLAKKDKLAWVSLCINEGIPKSSLMAQCSKTRTKAIAEKVWKILQKNELV